MSGPTLRALAIAGLLSFAGIAQADIPASGVVGAAFERGNHFGAARGVAQTHRQVARPALVPDAPDRAAFHPRIEFRFGPREQFDETRAIEAVADGGEIAFSARLRETIPRAGELAVVAAVDAVVDQRAQFFRNGASFP